MKVRLPVIRNLSIAMTRVALGLREYAPKSVEFVDDPVGADLEVLHVIGNEALGYETPAKMLAVIQYCVGPRDNLTAWHPLWARAKFTASYYDLATAMPNGARFLQMPLGVDGTVFNVNGKRPHRDIGIMTSGYVTGPGAEAIEEVARAACANALPVFHIGPIPVGLSAPLDSKYWSNEMGISDRDLAAIYRRSRWVSGLRYQEGFELPVIEGLACGARPIVFDRPDMRQWYDKHAVFVPECSGSALIEILSDVLAVDPNPVTPDEQKEVLAYFHWKRIAEQFWTEVCA